MAAVVEIDELNGAAPGTLTHGVTNSNMGSVDSPNLNATTNYLLAGAKTYEKWQKMHFTDLGGAASVDNFKVYRSGALGGAAVHKTNLKNPVVNTTYTTPTNGTPNAALSQDMPTTIPASTNIGVSGGTGGLSAPGSSDVIAHQIQTNAADVNGSLSNMIYQWDEIV